MLLENVAWYYALTQTDVKWQWNAKHKKHVIDERLGHLL